MLLAAKMLAGVGESTLLVPEGYEDYSCEGGAFEQIQVKSRQLHRGEFSVGEVAGFVVDVASALQSRSEAEIPGRPVLVIERGIRGIAGLESPIQIGDLPAGNALRHAVAGRAEQSGVARDVCDSTEIRVIDRSEARAEAARVVCERYGLLPQAGEVVLRSMWHEIVRCMDRNTAPELHERAAIDRTRLEMLAAEARMLVDNAALEEALTSGAAEPLDLSTPLIDARFYQGVSAQPGHVVAGLATGRPQLEDAVAAGSDSGHPVLITGPSGAGKSVLLWLAAREMPETLWFRIRRLEPEDVPALVALARAYKPSLNSRIGFVIDAVGLGRIRAWDDLQREISGIPGVRLIGTIRLEDVPQVRSLADCVTVEVGLDEELAQRIHDQLAERGVQLGMHWRTALDQSNRLTLEYTHLLTRGKRLDEVISDQVRARRSASRFDELRILALVTSAHRWGTELELRRVQEHLGMQDAELTQALDRLLDEHLLSRHGSKLGGLHQLRSTALSRAVHATPPPLLAETIKSILNLVEDDELGSVVGSVLVDYSEYDGLVLDLAHSELVRRANLTTWTSLLHALRVVDFRRVANSWPSQFRAAGIPPSLWSVTTQFALTPDRPATAIFRRDVTELSSSLREDLAKGSDLRDAFLRLCEPAIVTRIFTCSDNLSELTRALAVCDRAEVDLTPGFEAIPPTVRFAEAIARASLDHLGELLHAAGNVSPELALALLERVGGEAAVLRRLYRDDAGLAYLGIETRGEDMVLIGELVTLDESEVSAERHLNQFVKKAMLCLPRCDVTDLRSTHPDGTPLTVGGSPLEKRVRRERLSTSTDISWNRVRLNIASLLGGVPDPIQRLIDAHALVKELRLYTDLLLDYWLSEPRSRSKLAKLAGQGQTLLARADEMRPPIPDDHRALVEFGGTPMAPHADPVSSLVQSIAGNVSERLLRAQPDFAPLAAFLADQVHKQLVAVRGEPWHLAGLEWLDKEPTFAELLEDLRAVVAELGAGSLSWRTVVAVAGSGRGRLTRAATLARSTRSQALEQWLSTITEQVRTSFGHDAVVNCREPASSCVARICEDIAVGVHVQNLDEWFAIADRLPVIFTEHPEFRWSAGTKLIVPLLAHRPIGMLAVRVIRSVFPGADVFQSWTDAFEAAWQTSATDAVNDAYRGLIEISAVGALRSRRGPHPDDERRVSRARSLYADSVARLRSMASMPTDLVREVADELARVHSAAEADLASGGAPEETYASAVLAGLQGSPTKEFQQQVGLSLTVLAAELETQVG